MLITEFYNNQVIFITGGLGFIGKVVIEKLLSACPGIAKIYVLVRVKKGKTTEERLEHTLKDTCFRRLWKERPEVFQKIEAIEGDCCKLHLGIAPNDIERLRDVSIIIHSAATVRFDEPLHEAIFLNTRATHELLKIATNLRKLKAFVHVSTCYSNPAEAEVLEKVYEPSIDWRDAIKLAETVDSETLNILTAKISNRHPNTYTFSKNLAEKIVLEYKDKLPVTIFRPSIVVSGLKEPIPGWIDNLNGPMGLFLLAGIGIKRSEFCNLDICLAVVPVDIVARGIIISGYKLGINNTCSNIKREVDVYNCALGKTAPFTLFQLVKTGAQHLAIKPFEKTIWVPGGTVHQKKILYLLQVMVHLLPLSILLDGILRLKGKKSKVVKLQRILVSTSKALHYFMFTEWNFRTEKFFGLEDSVPPEEKNTFGFLEHCYLDWEKFFPDMIRGIREFILKEPREPSTRAIIYVKITVVMNYILQGLLGLWLLQFVYRWLIL